MLMYAGIRMLSVTEECPVREPLDMTRGVAQPLTLKMRFQPLTLTLGTTMYANVRQNSDSLWDG